MVGVRARVELKAVDRQTTLVVGVSEQIAGKQALQAAAADLAERVLPKLVTQEKKK